MNSHNKTTRGGFTLIELLVVISIIGLLSSIVLASVSSTKKKAQDATIISDLRNFMNQAELSYSSNGNYSAVTSPNDDGTYSPDTLPYVMWQGITNAGGSAACHSLDNVRWACSATNSDVSKIWTVSSQGGVLTWDSSDRTFNTWANALSSCTNAGERLPILEEVWTAYFVSGTSPFFYVGWGNWSSTETSPGSNQAWYVYIDNTIITSPFWENKNVLGRCVH